jgi:putative MATE family efflux protein
MVLRFFVSRRKSMNKLQDKPIRPLLYTMAIPLMFSLLVQSLYNIVDSIFVAKLSEDALTAASLVYSIQFLMIAIGVGTAVGLNALLSKKIGEKKIEEACNAATTGLILVIMTSLIFTFAGIFFSKQIASFLTNIPTLQLLCEEYLSINLVYCFGLFLQTYAQRLLQAVGDTFLSMISLVIGAIINIILDPILIFGLLGCPALGIKGAAIATILGQFISAIAACLFNKFKNPLIHVHLKKYQFKIKDIQDIYRVGLPTIIMQTIGSVMTLVINSILMSVSSTAVAFFGIYYKLQNFLMMPINGLGQASIPVISFNYGAKLMDRVKDAWHVLLPSGTIISICGTILFLVFPKQLLELFSASPSMLEMGVPALRIIAFTFVPATITTLTGYFASGMQNGVINMVGTAIRQLIILVPALWILIQTIGISYAWFSFWIAEIIACIYSYFSARKLINPSH